MGQLHPDLMGLGHLRRIDRPVPDIVFYHAAARTDRAARRDARADAGRGVEMTEPALHGIVGEFPTSLGAVTAALQLRDAGFRPIAAYTPYPIEALDEVVRSGRGLRR